MGPTEADYKGFYGADIGQTVVIDATDGSLTAHTEKLIPGRYIVVARGFSDDDALAWIHVGTGTVDAPLVIAPAVVNPTGPGERRIPLSANGFVEFQVVQRHNELIAAQMSAGTGTIYVSCISRERVQRGR